MAITAAQVEANGWVLRLTFTGSLGSFASYTLDPSGTPRVTLFSQHAGFVKSAGTAIAGTLNRATVATKPLRQPAFWTGTALLQPFVIDETDLGGGSIQVRIALSETIYATDTSLSLAVLAGWRTGESAASGIAVTNNSTVAAPIPIMRWVRPQYEIATGTFRLSLLVASHHPVGFDPVAGVKFTITDGTTVKTVWTTALGTDNDYGDNLRCHTVQVDPATATALTAGLLRCDAEVYPYLGSMRATDTAGTKSMTGLATVGVGAGPAETPLVVGYDPAGNRYTGLWIVVDPAGTTTGSAGMVQTSLAAAKAVAPASRAQTLTAALNAINAYARTLPAANGQSSQAKAADGVKVVLVAGVHVPSTTNPTTGPTAAEIPMIVMGDPDDADPRTNVIYRTGTVAAARLAFLAKVRFRDMTLEVGGVYLVSTATHTFWLDNIEIRGKSGQTASTVTPFQGTVEAITRSKLWQTGYQPYVRNLVRNTASSRQTACPVIVKHRFIGAGNEDTTIATSVTEPAMTAFSSSSSVTGLVEDNIVAYGDFRYARGKGINTNPTATAAAAGTPNLSLRRLLILNNVWEKIGPTTDVPFYAIGEDQSLTMSYNIVEGNTFVGDRNNHFYSDPLPATVSDTNTQLNQAYVQRVANNFFYWMPTKHDAFNDPQTAAVRGTANGYRPQMTAAWSSTYGVGYEGNAFGDVGQPFIGEYQGLRSYRGTYSPSWFTNDRSRYGIGTGSDGGGNYVPVAGSPLVGVALRGNSDVDLANITRASSAGAFELPAGPIAGTLSFTLANSADIAGKAITAGSLGISLNLSGVLGGAPPLNAILPVVSIAVSGTLTASGALTGSPVPLRFTASGTLTGGGALAIWTIQYPGTAVWTLH